MPHYIVTEAAGTGSYRKEIDVEDVLEYISPAELEAFEIKRSKALAGIKEGHALWSEIRMVLSPEATRAAYAMSGRSTRKLDHVLANEVGDASNMINLERASPVGCRDCGEQALAVDATASKHRRTHSQAPVSAPQRSKYERVVYRETPYYIY